MSTVSFREWLRESERISLTEVQRTGHQERDEFSAEKEWIRLSKNNLPKLLKSKDHYSLYKYHDYLFLIKGGNYITYMDGITDKLEGRR